MPKSTAWFTLFGLTLALLPVLSGQVERASVIGNVNNRSCAAMAGVEITVTNESPTPAPASRATMPAPILQST